MTSRDAHATPGRPATGRTASQTGPAARPRTLAQTDGATPGDAHVPDAHETGAPELAKVLADYRAAVAAARGGRPDLAGHDPIGRPVFAGKPYAAKTTRLHLVVVEDENATKGTYDVEALQESDAVVVRVLEIEPSVPDPKAKPDARRTVLRRMRAVKLPTIKLHDPLGDRPVLDAATGRPVELWED